MHTICPRFCSEVIFAGTGKGNTIPGFVLQNALHGQDQPGGLGSRFINGALGLLHIPLGDGFLLLGQKDCAAVRFCLDAEPVRSGLVLRAAVRQFFQNDRQAGLEGGVFDFNGKIYTAPNTVALYGSTTASFV